MSASGFITAWRTLTILPIPGTEAVHYRDSLPYFPIVGALLGSVLLLVAVALSDGTGILPEIVSVVILLLGTVLTGGMHLDGLADAADGLCCLATSSRRLEIMKDPRVGSFGAIALLLALLAKWVFLFVLIKEGAILFVVPAFVFSRTAMVELATTMPYGRSKGTAGAFVAGAGAKHRLGAWTLGIVLCAMFGIVTLFPLLLGVVTVWLIRNFFLKKLNSVTGDLLGASSELCECVSLLAYAVCASNLFLCQTAPMIFRPVWSWI